LAKSQSTQQVTCVAELEQTNASLRAELDVARLKLVEIEHRERALTSKNESLKRDLGPGCTTQDVAVKDKDLVQQAEQSKLQRFQDSIRKRLTELQHDMEASVSALGGRSAEFPIGASLSDFFKWFQTEISSMPTTSAECNENITCYVLIGVFQMPATEGCEHVPELRKLGHSYDASILHNFPVDTGRIAKRLVKNWWNAHDLPYCMHKIEEENWVSFVIHYFQVTLSADHLTCLLLSSRKLTKALEVTAPTRALKQVETARRQRLLRKGPSWLRWLVKTRRRTRTYLRWLSRSMRPLLQRCECLEAGSFWDE
jgi:hypothetical protein